MSVPATDMSTDSASEASTPPIAVSAAQVTPATVAGTTAVPMFLSPSPSQQSIRSANGPTAAPVADAPRVPEAKTIHQQVEQIVAQEREAAAATPPRYEGLPEQFELVEKLGDGTFSIVYKALDHATGKHVAVKIVRKQDKSQDAQRVDPALREQNRATERATILKEVQIMRRLRHDSIVQLLSFTESDEHCFLVMELLNGGELFEQIVQLTYLSEPLARHVILQVAHGIRYMHEECGIVHRDIKPENLLFDSLEIIPSENPIKRPYDEDKMDEGVFRDGIGGGGIGRVKIADFGLSKIVWEENTKTPCGTVGYAAPEIVKDEQYSKSVDMWALGCVLYTLLCGFPPFYDESIKTLSEKVSKGEYSFLSPWWDDISDSAKDLVSHLLTVDVSKRFTIDQFLAHEWCRGADASSAEAIPIPHTAAKANAKVHWHSQDHVLDSPLLAPVHRKEADEDAGVRTANAYRLREAFDVSFAVHRIEEEMQQRVRVSKESRRQRAWRSINADSSDDERRTVDAAQRRHGKDAARAISERRQAILHKDKSDTPPKRQGFNLHLDGATILERRKRAVAQGDTAKSELPHYTAEALIPIPSGVA